MCWLYMLCVNRMGRGNVVFYSICLFNIVFADCRQLSVRDVNVPLLIVYNTELYHMITITVLLLYGAQVFPEYDYVL